MTELQAGDRVTHVERPGALVVTVLEVTEQDGEAMVRFADPDDGTEHTMPAAQFTVCAEAD